MGTTLRVISPGDRPAQARMDRLLTQEGIRRDGNLDYSCGIFDEDEELIATGSCFGNTLRCLAVASDHRGEGLLNQIVGHLMEVELARGNSRLFLYTKPAAARFLGELGFYEIARVEGTLVFMENRRSGFRDYCQGLEREASREGTAAAIVMNANPFTLGHRYLVERASEENDTVHLFLLSEEAGPIPHAVRRKLAEAGVQDLPNVRLHETGPYLISSATFPSYFLRDSDTAIRAQAALDLAVFTRIARCLGITRRYVGQEKTSHVTGLYNEVMKEKLPLAGIECREIPRLEVEGRGVSASTVRKAIQEGRLSAIRSLVPESTYRYFSDPESAPVREAIERCRDVIHY